MEKINDDHNNNNRKTGSIQYHCTYRFSIINTSIIRKNFRNVTWDLQAQDEKSEFKVTKSDAHRGIPEHSRQREQKEAKEATKETGLCILF